MKSYIPIRILVLGASGMLGNAIFRFFSRNEGYVVFGTVRSGQAIRLFPVELRASLIAGVDVENIDNLTRLFSQIHPDFVINCVGLVKQLAQAEDALSAIPINSLLPHRLARLCEIAGARLTHISTDCVFNGQKGMYTESDAADATDLYGRSKYLGEVDYPNAITLRTSIIGHELDDARSLVGWFLAQEGRVKGYKRAIFSGLPTVEIARIIRDYVIPNSQLHGLYHVSADPINKFDLLKLVAEVYGKKIDIEEDKSFVIDRSLNSTLFRLTTGFEPEPWPELVRRMHAFS